MHPQCPNASNPYHRCGERCLQKINAGNKPSSGLNSLMNMLFKFFHVSEIGYGNSCAVPAIQPRETVENSKISSPENGKNVYLKCPNLSNPSHKCSESCLKRIDAGKELKEEDLSGLCILDDIVS